MLIPDDYNLIFIKLPGDVHSGIRIDADGYPTVYINVDLSPNGRQKALDHELGHFTRGDLTNHLTIWEAETDTYRTSPIGFAFRMDSLSCQHSLTDEEFIAYMYAGYQLRKKWELVDALPLPDRLMAYRKSKRIGRAEAARRFGVTEHDIWAYEHGKAEPPKDVLQKMRQAYEMV